MTEDAHRLARFAKKGDETAFRELVTRVRHGRFCAVHDRDDTGKMKETV